MGAMSLAVGLVLTSSNVSYAAAGDVTNNIVGSVVSPASYSCPFGGAIDAAMRQDYKLTTNVKSLLAPKITSPKFVGIPQSLTCGTWLYGFSFESLGAPVINTVVCQGADYKATLPAAAWNKIVGKKLCTKIDYSGTIKLIRRSWVDIGFTWKGFAIGIKSGDQVQQTKSFTLQTMVNTYGYIHTHSTLR